MGKRSARRAGWNPEGPRRWLCRGSVHDSHLPGGARVNLASAWGESEQLDLSGEDSLGITDDDAYL